MNESLRIGFIGAGNIAQALAKGFLNSNYVKPDQITVSAPSDRNLEIFKNLGCKVYNKNELIFEQYRDYHEHRKNKSFILFICVKPNIASNINFWSFLYAQPNLGLSALNCFTIVSVMAGIKLEKIYSNMATSYKKNGVLDLDFMKAISLARIMPNTACSINNGVVGLCFYKNCPESDEYFPKIQQRNIILKDLLDKLGNCFLVEENQMDALCGISGSGIAFVYTFIQAMSDGGVLSGLPRELSTQLTLQTILGATKMVKETESNPIALRDQVCSPAGTTINGIYSLERGHFNCIVMDAIKAATDRSKEFSQN